MEKRILKRMGKMMYGEKKKKKKINTREKKKKKRFGNWVFIVQRSFLF